VDRDKDEWYGFLGLELDGFSSMCNKLTSEDIMRMRADMGLQAIKDSKKR